MFICNSGSCMAQKTKYNSISCSRRIPCACSGPSTPQYCYCTYCCLFQASYDAVCIQFILSECNTTTSVMSNVNARHYTGISPRRHETNGTNSTHTSQYPHSETPKLTSILLTLSTVKISTPLLRATAADSQFQQDSGNNTFRLLFQLALLALTNRRLNHQVPSPPNSQQLAQILRP